MTLPQVLITNGDMTADIISTTVDGFTIKIGQIFELKDAPNVRRLARMGNMKTDRWFCPMEVFHDSGKKGQAIVFFSPPYDNVSIGFVWFKSDWSQAEVISKAVDTPVREGLNALVMTRHATGSFDRLKSPSASDTARLALAQEKRQKKADRLRRSKGIA